MRLIQAWHAKRAYLSHPTRAARAGTPHLATIFHACSVKTHPLTQGGTDRRPCLRVGLQPGGLRRK